MRGTYVSEKAMLCIYLCRLAYLDIADLGGDDHEYISTTPDKKTVKTLKDELEGGSINIIDNN